MTEGKRMDKKLKAKWVAALTSEKYSQTQHRLRDGFGGYCCLGVLHLVATGKEPPTLWDDDRPVCVRRLGKSIELELARMNDEGVPFEVIAGLIHEVL